jgi:hypothetical protein
MQALRELSFLCLPQWNQCRKTSCFLCRTPIPAARSPTSLCCFHQGETLPYGVCALLSVHQHDRKESCHCCPWLQFKCIRCHCKVGGTFYWRTCQNAVVQLVNTNCWFWRVLKMIWLLFNVPLKLVEMISGQCWRVFESRTSEQCLIFIL